MSERADVTALSPDDTFAEPAFAAMLEAVFAQAELAMPETAETITDYVDESDQLYIGREFSSVDEFARWYAAQRLGGMPFNAIGYHHTFRPHAPNWGGLTSLNR